MKIDIVLSEKDLQELVKEKIESMIDKDINSYDIKIEVKSKQNYKAEWESAAFRATYTKTS